MTKSKVQIVMGSKSDFPKMKQAIQELENFGIPFEVSILSAHRTADTLTRFISYIDAKDPNSKVIIAGAGMNAALAGSIAAQTIKPVIAVPLSGGNAVNEFTAILSTLQMPPGVPVLTVGLDQSKNAALAAISILALSDDEIAQKLYNFRVEQRNAVLSADIELSCLYSDEIAKKLCNVRVEQEN